ncbi:MAG: 2Fe-2S iron-sulfur cluster-binding protein, partial [Plesiomonas sp.]
GPEGYMQSAVQLAKTLGVPAEQIHQEAFFTATASEAVTHTDNVNACSFDEQVTAPNTVRMHIRHALRDIDVPVGTSLLAAMEQHNLPVFAACRAGVCGSCKVQIIEGEVDTTSQSGLTQAEIEQGYVLACSCRIKQNITLA